MADAVIAGTVTGLMAGGGGYVFVEIVRGWHDRRTQRLNERKAPSEIEATISAGAKDAVTALRETLVEYRAEIAETRARCDDLEAKLGAAAQKLRQVERELAEERQARAVAERELATLKGGS